MLRTRILPFLELSEYRHTRNHRPFFHRTFLRSVGRNILSVYRKHKNYFGGLKGIGRVLPRAGHKGPERG